MNILLTNDDGIHAKGIEILEEALKDYGNIYVCAPMNGKSGAASGLSIFKYLPFEKIDDRHIALDGTPVDCVIYGLNGFGVQMDLVVSGCNNGYNLSFDAMYSGTIGACFQALIGKVKTIAFSMERNFYEQHVKEEIVQTMDYVLKHDLLSNQYLLNVNFPNMPYIESKGMVITRQFIRTVSYECIEDNQTVLLERKILTLSDDINEDVGACSLGYTSITPLQMTRFNEELYQQVKSKINE